MNWIKAFVKAVLQESHRVVYATIGFTRKPAYKPTTVCKLIGTEVFDSCIEVEKLKPKMFAISFQNQPSLDFPDSYL